MAFIRVVEHFACEHCGFSVQGSGYTNHCPKCLWSKHVDIDPGDRKADCGGMMEPMRIEGSSPEYDIVHRCVRCGQLKRNKVQAPDDPAAIVALAAKGDRPL